MDNNPVKVLAEVNVTQQKQRRRKKMKKKKASDGPAVEGMDQTGNNMEQFGSEKHGMIAKEDLQDKLTMLDSAPKLSEEHPKADALLYTEPLQRKRRKKKKASNGPAVKAMDQTGNNMEQFESGKNGMVARGDLQDKLITLDSAAGLSQEHPKADALSTTEHLERKRRKKKKASNGPTVEGMDQTGNNMEQFESEKKGMIAKGDLQDKLIMLDSAMELSQEHPKAEALSTTEPLERKRRKKKKGSNGPVIEGMDQPGNNMEQFESDKNGMIAKGDSQDKLVMLDSATKKWRKKKKASYGAGVEGMDQTGNNMEQFQNEKNSMISKGDLQDKFIMLDSVTKLSQKHPKADALLTTEPLENKSRKKKKASNGLAVEGMDQTSNNTEQFESEKIGMIAKGDLDDKLVMLNSATKLSQEYPKADALLSTEPLERKRRKKKKASNGPAVEGMDQTGDNMQQFESGKNGMVARGDLQDKLITLDSDARLSREHPKADALSTTEHLERKRRKKKKASNGPTVEGMDQTGNNLEQFESEKNGMIAKGDLQAKLIMLDSAMELSQEHPKAEALSTTEPLEKLSKSRKGGRRRAKKKAALKCEPQNMDHTDIISNLSLADACNGCNGIVKKESLKSPSESVLSGHLSGPLSDLAQKDENILDCGRHNQTALSQNMVNVSGYNVYPILSGDRLECGMGVRNTKVKTYTNEIQYRHQPKRGIRNNEKFDSAIEHKNECFSYYGQSSTQSWSKEGLLSFNEEVTEHTASEVLDRPADCLLVLPCQIPERARAICSRRKLLVLDVNGLLADIVTPPPRECRADVNICGRGIFKRPFCDDFLKFCFERFDVGIWSSRSKKIIDKVVNYLLGDLKHKLLFCWDMFYCTETGFRTLENRHKPMVFKELRKLWEKIDPNLPWHKGYYDASNTLLLDDSPYKALHNPMHTAVFPYSYSYSDTSDNSLGPGGDLRVYLESLATADNVQNYVEQHPFGQSAINERSSLWSFYSRVLCTLQG